LMLYFQPSLCPYKCTPLNPRYARSFPVNELAMKVIDLAIANISKKWTMPFAKRCGALIESRYSSTPSLLHSLKLKEQPL
jgi:hypothetical protein